MALWKQIFPELLELMAPASTPLKRSNLLTHFAAPTWSIRSSTRGNGKESGFIAALTLRKSLQRGDLYISTSKHGKTHCCYWACTSFQQLSSASLQRLHRIGFAPHTSILCSSRFGFEGASPNKDGKLLIGLTNSLQFFNSQVWTSTFWRDSEFFKRPLGANTSSSARIAASETVFTQQYEWQPQVQFQVMCPETTALTVVTATLPRFTNESQRRNIP